jgi:hypothetical protein
MPLPDHFHPPLSVERPWAGMHSTWASTMAMQLNQDQLPAEYFAMPLITVGGGVQVDVGTFQSGEQQEGVPGGVATQIWAPPQPLLSAVVDFVSLDVYEVRVMQQMVDHSCGQPLSWSVRPTRTGRVTVAPSPSSARATCNRGWRWSWSMSSPSGPLTSMPPWWIS